MTDRDKVEQINVILTTLEPREYRIGALVGLLRRTIRDAVPEQGRPALCQEIGEYIATWGVCAPLMDASIR